MMRLWVDDVRPMPKGFNNHAKTYDEALSLLFTGKVKEVSLDHDLGEKDGKDGYGIAKFIWMMARNGGIPRLRWSIHSANPVGRRNMEEALKKADECWP